MIQKHELLFSPSLYFVIIWFYWVCSPTLSINFADRDRKGVWCGICQSRHGELWKELRYIFDVQSFQTSCSNHPSIPTAWLLTSTHLLTYWIAHPVSISPMKSVQKSYGNAGWKPPYKIGPLCYLSRRFAWQFC